MLNYRIKLGITGIIQDLRVSFPPSLNQDQLLNADGYTANVLWALQDFSLPGNFPLGTRS